MDKHQWTDEQKIEYLERTYGFNHGTAMAYVRSKGRCTYCQENVLSTREGYSSGQIDHVLPAARYPQIASDINNWVYCCSSCNFMKHELDVLQSGEDPVRMITEEKEELITRVRTSLKEKIDKRTVEFEDIRGLLQPSSDSD